MRRKTAHATKRLVPRSISTALPRLFARVIDYCQGFITTARSSIVSLGLMSLMAVLIVMLMINLGNQVVQSARLESDRSALQAEVDRLRNETEQLAAAVEHAESDVHVERVAREQLNYAREGDVVVLPQVVIPTPAPTPAPVASLPEPPTIANWQRWYVALFPSNSP
jgi:cell division protein FtsB